MVKYFLTKKISVDNDGKKFESVYSAKVRAGKRRTYFFDVRKTKGDDFYVTLTESTKRFNGDGYDRHKIFLYKEDFNRFLSNLEDVVNHVKTELMPDYDYDEYTKRQLEWEAKIAAEKAAEAEAEAKRETEEPAETEAESTETEEAAETEEGAEEAAEAEEGTTESEEGAAETEEDISW